MTNSNTGSQNRSYIPSLQSLRFIFCMLIFVCHYLHNSSDIRFDYGGDAGVVFFFILSGFVLSCGYGHRVDTREFSQWRFLRKRIGKLYPLHIITLAAALFMSMAAGARFSVVKTALHVLMLQEFTLSADIIGYANGPSWFLGALLLCYALFQYIYKCASMSGKISAYVAGLVYLVAYVAIVSRCSDDFINDSLYAFPLFRIGDFALGIIAYRIYAQPVSVKLKRWLARQSALPLTVCDVLVVGTCVSTAFAYRLLPLWFRMSMLFWVPFMLLVYWLAVSDGSRGYVSKILRSRALQALGGISFEIYMIHCIVIAVCNFVWGRTFGYGTIPNGTHFAMCLVVTFAVSYTYACLARNMRKAQ